MGKTIERKAYTENIKGFIDKELIKIITGIRRCGKSEILKLIKEEILKRTNEEHIVFINFEDVEFDNLLTYKKLYSYIVEKMKDEKKYYLFFDEIQMVEDWEKAVNSLRLKNTDIYITGSNSKLLSGELATLLAGRYVQFEIKPLSFKEFVEFREKLDVGFFGTAPQAKITKLNQKAAIYDYSPIREYIEMGGFPLISTQHFDVSQAVQIVKDIHLSIVFKDVVVRNKVKNVALLEKLIAYFYDNVGSPTSLRNIAEWISGGDKNKIASNLDTLSNYISYLETAYVIQKVQPYDISGKQIILANSKYYLADHSLSYAIKDIKKVNKGSILENIVYNELVSRGYKVSFGRMSARDNREIDFIAEKNGEKIYVQVCLEFTTEETYNREFAPLKDIKDNYPKYVVSLDSYANRNDEGIIGISLNDFLLNEMF
ncbi:MAG: ATP-binding protein [Firmicutes bacterium]|nr:ATP-binding protein [Bacillota bacterium]